ncbi:hypothetical protein GYMLUDRAFT_63370 [Collybiopsis luxurians FD-317 M1]|uniref:Uncharacterized protein n=1 Tax=Collybiopsis luxurians FD-317 M1 TaxID=944289 RepID=A0A0D0AU72_9AGAR|nr:hypothetical protein GYMLUDRAFT_63370 [Collybiopsis luxurians FD-317 M1]
MLDKLYDELASGVSLATIQASREKDRPMQMQVRDLCKLHIQGVVEEKWLPPINEIKRNKQIQHLKQTITISRLRSKRFDKDIDTIIEVYAVFARQVGNLDRFKVKENGGKCMLEFGNQIFTPKWEAPTMEWYAPLPEVDPQGRIESMNTEDSHFVHGTENVVDYGEEKHEQDGEKRTYSIKPDKIHVGDIVDIAFSIMAVPMKQGLRAFLVLRAVTLLDGSHTQVREEKPPFWLQSADSSQNWIKAQIQGKMPTNAGVQLKKRSAFDDKDEANVEEARKKLKRLVVSDKAKMDVAQ